jgi:hypothetical protein
LRVILVPVKGVRYGWFDHVFEEARTQDAPRQVLARQLGLLKRNERWKPSGPNIHVAFSFALRSVVSSFSVSTMTPSSHRELKLRHASKTAVIRNRVLLFSS